MNTILGTSVLCASEQPAINYDIIFMLVGAMSPLIFGRGGSCPHSPLPSYAYGLPLSKKLKRYITGKVLLNAI